MKSVCIISVLRETCEFLKKQLDDIFENYVRIDICVLSELEDGSGKIDCDLAVYASENAMRLSKDKLILKAEGILANRSVNYDHLDGVLSIPDGTETYIFNDFEASTVRTMDYLISLGIDHIKYIPIWPGVETDGITRPLITVDEFDNLPSNVSEIINIGIRTIDVSTLVEIMLRLDLPQDLISKYTVRYVSDIISLAKEINILNKHNDNMRSKLEGVVHYINDGIMTIGEDGKISVMNPACCRILNYRPNNIIGKTSSELPHVILQAMTEAANNKSGQDVVFSYNGKNMVINALGSHGGEQIFVLNEIQRIQKIEQNLRVKLARNRYEARYTFDDIKGESEEMKRQKNLAANMAKYNLPVYIFGESGTGKELFAQAIHNASTRNNGPFVAVNFAAMSESLLESELFGYAEGAFTGARKGGMPGVFEQAHGGTIFLDEIGDSPLSFQIKLLRVLQEKQVRRIGDDKLIPVDVRVIVATNKDIYKLVKEGKFREDLYYRLNVLPLKLSSLREMREDIPLIAKEFYCESSKDMSWTASFDEFFEGKMDELMSYDYRGNIRQLRNVVDYLVFTSSDGKCPDIKNAFGEEIRNVDGESNNYAHSDESETKETRDFISELSSAISKNTVDEGSVLKEIAVREVNNLSSGRRSLAKSLGISEEKVKSFCADLEKEGKIIISRGRKGIKISEKGYEEIKKGLKV